MMIHSDYEIMHKLFPFATAIGNFGTVEINNAVQTLTPLARLVGMQRDLWMVSQLSHWLAQSMKGLGIIISLPT